MLVGVTVDPHDYLLRLPAYPGSRMCRVFGYAGAGMPAWKPAQGDRRISDLLGYGIEPAAVFQDWPDDGAVQRRLATWLDRVDAPCRLTWRHEADRKSEPVTTYRRRWYLLAQWVADHPGGRHVTLAPTQTYQWTMADAAGKGRSDWSLYYTGIGNTAVDVYANSWEREYPSPATFLTPLWRYRDAIGRPIELPEFGAARVATDVDGQRRAAWLYQCAQAMRAEGVTAVCYWDNLGSNGTDLRLWSATPDTPELQAWRAVIEENKAA